MNAEISKLGQIVTWTTPEEMIHGYSVIGQAYPQMDKSHYEAALKAIEGHDYRQFAYISQGGSCLGVVGLWFIPRIWCGLQADVDNFVVDQKARSLGIGKQLLDYCIRAAKERGAEIVALDTYVDNPASHRFYFREGFTIRGYHFVKALQGQNIWNHSEHG